MPVISAVEIGEHLFDITKKVVQQMNGCLERGVSPNAFRQAMEMLDSEESAEDLKEIGCTGGEDWLDELGGRIYDFSEFYENGVAGNATRFIIFDNHSFISVVAVQGDPGAAAIEKHLCDIPGDGFETLTPWPQELGEGAPIDILYVGGSPQGIATLRDGREVRVE